MIFSNGKSNIHVYAKTSVHEPIEGHCRAIPTPMVSMIGRNQGNSLQASLTISVGDFQSTMAIKIM
jgi:hypothetical protein